MWLTLFHSVVAYYVADSFEMLGILYFFLENVVGFLRLNVHNKYNTTKMDRLGELFNGNQRWAYDYWFGKGSIVGCSGGI